MSERRKLLILGAGAIGRGYLPWVFDPAKYALGFVDTDVRLIEQMRRRGRYVTYRVNAERLEPREVEIAGAWSPGDFDHAWAANAAAVFINVGPRAAVAAARLVDGLRCPIVLSENDPATVDAVKAATSLRDVYFAVPDVITSNTAPADIVAKDPLAIVTESGEFFVDDRFLGVDGAYSALPAQELIGTQWTAKLFLHNTPHCVAAYLGALVGAQYLHEAMEVPEIEVVVQGAMEEMLTSLKLKWSIPHAFLDWYAAKEMRRFRCALLCDPIARVAREPLRKLEADGRLLGAAQICLAQGFVPQNILTGIGSALLFDDDADADSHLKFMRRALSPAAFVTHVLNLRRGEALERALEERLSSIIGLLQDLAEMAPTARAAS